MILYNKEKGSLWISRPGIYNSIYTSERSEREIFGVFRCWNGHFFDKCCRYIKHFVGTPRKLCRTNIPVHQAPTTSLRWNSPDWLISPEYFANWGGRGPPGPPFGHATVQNTVLRSLMHGVYERYFFVPRYIEVPLYAYNVESFHCQTGGAEPGVVT